jgi:hypothetical protein
LKKKSLPASFFFLVPPAFFLFHFFNPFFLLHVVFQQTRSMARPYLPAPYSDAFVEEYEKISEDPSNAYDNVGMDISPQSPWKTPVKIEPGVSAAAGVGKDVEGTVYALKNLSIAGSPMPKAAVSPAGIIRKKSKCL